VLYNDRETEVDHHYRELPFVTLVARFNEAEGIRDYSEIEVNQSGTEQTCELLDSALAARWRVRAVFNAPCAWIHRFHLFHHTSTGSCCMYTFYPMGATVNAPHCQQPPREA
jgi:hypothetical protein